MKVFSMAPTSAESERNFSTMGFVHSKLRNRLGSDTVETLVYIRTNVPVKGKGDASEASIEDYFIDLSTND